MKLLSIKINNSINCVFNFDNPNRYPKTYVVNNTSTDPILFSLQTTNSNGRMAYMLQTERGRKDISLLSVEDIENEVQNKETSSNLISRTITLKFFARDYIPTELSTEQKTNIEKKILEYKKGFPSPDLRRHCTPKGDFLCLAGSHEIVEYTVVLVIVSISRFGAFREESSSFKIVLCPRKHIYQATLDFGSEASQALEYNCNDAKIGGYNIMTLFRELGSTLGKSIALNDEEYLKNLDYIQFDKDKHLFRSHFFAPRSVDMTTECFEPACNPKDNPHLKMMTTYSEIDSLKETYFTLPNVKIASLTHDRPEVVVKTSTGEQSRDATQFHHRYFYRSAINAFIYQILKRTASEAEEEGIVAYLRLTVLMPNVYNQKELSIRMKDINEDVSALLELDEFKDIIRGVEVNSISESDASILGFMTADTKLALTLKKGNYLIIDAGKGTLDFSVLRFDPVAAGQVFLSQYRSGIVGSGNAITYAIFLDLMSAMLSSAPYHVPQEYIESGIKAIIRHLVMSGDEATLAELMKYVERYKRYYGELYPKGKETGSMVNGEPNGKKYDSPGIKCTFLYDDTLKKVEIIKKGGNTASDGKKLLISLQDDILEWVKNLFEDPIHPDTSSIKSEAPTTLSYTERMINQLRDDALKGFGYVGRIDYIVMSGRAFHLPQFSDAIISGIRSVAAWEKAQLIRWEDAQQVINAKNLCLYVNNMLSQDKYDGRVVGRPALRKHGEDPILYKTDEEKAEMGTFIAWLNGHTWTQWAVNPCITLTQKAKGKKPKVSLKSLFGDRHQPTIMNDKDYLRGISVSIESTLDQIAISGTNYTLPNNARVGVPATIYFDGDEFLYVSDGSAQGFDPVVSPSVFHVFESTFPYGFTRDDIPIPKARLSRPASPDKAISVKADGDIQEKKEPENNPLEDLTKEL